ncbi:hypothetical protein EFQ99_31445 [Rhizobium vallis]|uniref:Uncharacterized protein n=1 Tax=Rhizobium vallis TaxID=634290 RepID=A0A432PC07_9HYPH|nr:hypothetical protein [Rhizobium vallis]RUM19285.1 hypothetical protein EFQ99_31445 [Rhizobium vallis]
MLMIVFIFGLSIAVSQLICTRLPTGFLYSLLAWLCTVVAAFAATVMAFAALYFADPVAITPSDLVASSAINFTEALLLSPFVVWFLRRKARKQAAAPEA